MPDAGQHHPILGDRATGPSGWVAHYSVAGIEAPVVSRPAETPQCARPELPPLPSPARKRRPILWAGLVLAALLLLSVAWMALSPRGGETSGNSTEPLRTAKVQRRTFIRSVRINGTVEAVGAHPISAPRIAGQNASTLVITALVPTGTLVRPGDLIVEFDRQQQSRNALDKEAEYNDFVQQINKLKATQAAARAADDTELKAAEDALATAELEIRRTEVESRIQIEKAKETLDEARAKLKQLQQTYQLKRAADGAAVRLLEIQRDASQNAMRHAQHNAELMAIQAPVAGLVVLNTIFKNNGPGEVQAGDEVRPGVPFVQIVDPGAMRVRAHVNQEDMLGVETGARVEIRPDAYPQLLFAGRVQQIAAIGMGSNSSRTVHTFGVLFSIDGSDPKLLPDLSVAVDIELEKFPNSVVVPSDALLLRDGKTFVRVLHGDSQELRPVRLGARNEIETVVESGLQPGETVRRETAPDDNARLR